MKSFRFSVIVFALVFSSLAANAALLNFDRQAALLNERADSCGGVASIRFERFEAVLTLNTAVCNFVQVNSGRLLPNRVVYHLSLNRRHHVFLTSSRNRFKDMIEVNTFLPR